MDMYKDWAYHSIEAERSLKRMDEALEQRRYDDAVQEIRAIISSLERVASFLADETDKEIAHKLDRMARLMRTGDAA